MSLLQVSLKYRNFSNSYFLYETINRKQPKNKIINQKLPKIIYPSLYKNSQLKTKNKIYNYCCQNFTNIIIHIFLVVKNMNNSSYQNR